MHHRKLAIKALAVMGFAALSVSAVKAEVINTTDGAIVVTPGTVSYGEVGKYVSGGNGLVGDSVNYPNGILPAVAASNIDHNWLQGDPGIIWSFSTKEDKVLAFPGIDHDPVPQENLEFIIWGSNDGVTWEEGKILAIYKDGADPAATLLGQSDDYASLWGFTQGYSMIMATSGDHLDPHYGSVGEFEIDGVARTPDAASSGLLLSIGLASIGLLRRKM